MILLTECGTHNEHRPIAAYCNCRSHYYESI